MKTLFKFLLAGILFLYGCGGPKSVIETVPVNPSSSELQTGYVYALPQTTFKVTVALPSVSRHAVPMWPKWT